MRSRGHTSASPSSQKWHSTIRRNRRAIINRGLMRQRTAKNGGTAEFVVLLCGPAVAWPLATRAQHAGKMWRIAFITHAPNRDYNALFESLRELGYAEGQNIIVE